MAFAGRGQPEEWKDPILTVETRSKEKHERSAINKLAKPDLENELKASGEVTSGSKKDLKARLLTHRMNAWKANGCPPVHEGATRCDDCSDEDEEQPENESESEKFVTPGKSKGFGGMGGSSDMQTLLIMMMEDRQADRRRQERLEEERREERRLEQEIRRQELQSMERRIEETQRLWFDATMRTDARSSSNSPTSSWSGTVGSDEQLIKRKFTRMYDSVKRKVVDLMDLAMRKSDRNEIESFKQRTKEKFKTLEDFYEEKIDLLDGDETKDDICKDMNALEQEFEVTMRRTAQRIGELKKKEDEESKAGALSAGVVPPDFFGSPLKYPTWWEEFEAVVHNNVKVDRFHKMKYLKQCLKGTAASTLEQIPTHADNYETALEKVRQRFGKGRIVSRYVVRSILGIEEPKSKDAKELRKLHDVMVARDTTLLRQKPTLDTILVPIYEDKLPTDLKAKWEAKMAETIDKDECASKAQFFAFLQREVEALEATVDWSKKNENNQKDKQSNKNNPKDKAKGKDFKATGQFLNVQASNQKTNQNKSDECIFCSRNHCNHECPDLKAVPPAERWQFVIGEHRNKRVCIACLQVFGKDGHPSKRRCEQKCSECGGAHHELLHSESKKEDSSKPTTMITAVTRSQNGKKKMKKILPTALVRIRHAGREVVARMGMDSLAEPSFITKNLVEKLKLKPLVTGEMLEVHAYAGQTTWEPGRTVSLELMPLHNNEKIQVDEVYVTEKICDKFQSIDFKMEDYPYLKGIQMADQLPREEADVDLILGIEYFHALIDYSDVCSPKDPTKAPTALKTPFGYVISGPYETKNSERKVRSTNLHISTRSTTTDVLDSKLERFWKLDVVGIKNEKKTLTAEEKEAVEHFEKNTYFNGTRYVTSLPFKKSAVPLQNNYKIAKKILESTERRLLKDPIKKEEYCKAMNQYEELGFAKELTEEEEKEWNRGEMYYVPSHPVEREDSESTPVRAVFNLSSVDANGHSVNENVLPGPAIQPEINQVLIRFRWHTFVVTGDLKKMFCQTRLIKDDQRYQLYLWRDCNQNAEPRKMVMNSLMFGNAASPFLAGSCVHMHAKRPDMVEKFPRLVQEIQPNTYVDDHYNGRETIEEAVELQKNLVEFFKSGGWVIAKFATNSKEVLENIPPEDRVASLTLDFDKEGFGSTKALGLVWQTDEDELSIQASANLLNIVHTPTKRAITSKIASIYDVFGYVAPYVIKAKVLIQDLWKSGCGWDEEVNEDIKKQFRKWESELPKLREIKIPRKMLPPGKTPRSISLHGFSDASEDAYGAMAYIRGEYNDDSVETGFIMAKTRVSPIKKMMMPRLELMAAECLANLLTYVLEAFEPLDVQIDEVHAWSDSEIALAWIRKPSSTWKTFVANRVQSIHDQFSPSIWHFCPGDENPADKLTRGLTLEELEDDRVYWNGPAWLQMPREYWPEQTKKPEPKAEDMEAAKVKVRAMVIIEKAKHNDVIEKIIERREKFGKIVRIVARILRWIRIVRKKDETVQERGKELNADEVECAKNVVLREIQRKSFPSEYEEVSSKGSLTDKKSPILRWDPEFDKERQLMLVGGRLQYAEIPEDAKHQVILPCNNVLVRKLILDLHTKSKHAATETTMVLVREKYAIAHVRQEVKSSLKNCIVCRHASSRPISQKMGVLPEERVRIAPAFTEMGIDFTGAMLIKDGESVKKCYVLVCTCPATRMVHLELTEDMTTPEFIQALKRVMNRRGRCRGLHSDNQTSFKKASRVLSSAFNRQLEKTVHSPEVQRFLAEEGLTWTFIAERSPHRGGYWERLNRSIKEPLRKVLGKAMLKYTELYTLLTDIECALNQRPLTFAGSEHDDPLPITPAHLALGRSLSSFPSIPATIEPSLGKRYYHLQSLLKHFWKRWTEEYLPKLTTRSKWAMETEQIQVGDVCLITEETTSRPSWPLGRVTSLITSRDGIVRTVQLKTAKGSLTRPVQRLHLLEKMDVGERDTESETMENNPSDGHKTDVGNDSPQQRLDIPTGDNQGRVCSKDPQMPESRSKYGRRLMKTKRYGC